MNSELHSNELRRWQEAIRDLLIKSSGASDETIDGGGCDSGDPLDLTLTEITQAFNYVTDVAVCGYCGVKCKRNAGAAFAHISTCEKNPLGIMAAELKAKWDDELTRLRLRAGLNAERARKVSARLQAVEEILQPLAAQILSPQENAFTRSLAHLTSARRELREMEVQS